MNIIFNELHDFNDRVFHNVQGIAPGFDEFDDLSDDPRAQACAHRMSQASEMGYRFDELQYHAIDFIFKKESWQPTRFGNGSYPVWYGSLDLDTSFYETSYHWRKTFLEAPQDFSQPGDQPIATLRTVFTVNCQAALIDLRKKAEEGKELLDPSRYSSAQQVGSRVHREGYPGLVTKSARWVPGENVAVFRKEILTAPALENNYLYEYDLTRCQAVVKDRGKGAVRLIIGNGV